jgi:hypothetical protein
MLLFASGQGGFDKGLIDSVDRTINSRVSMTAIVTGNQQAGRGMGER